MGLANRERPYQALTYVNLPFINKRHAPGDEVSVSDLVEAQQSDEDIDKLIEAGALGEVGDEIHPDHIIPDPSIPTIQSVVAQAQAAVAEYERRGEKVPAKLKAVAELDTHHAVTSDEGAAHDSNG